MDSPILGDLLLKIITLWFAMDALVLATVWYAAGTLQYQFPGWWKTTICDYASTTEPFD